MQNIFKSLLYILRLIRSKSPILSVDGIILKDDKILLVRRAIPPFFGHWVLPGGHVRYGEKVEEAVKREMEEELGIEVEVENLVGVYSDPKRDPRYHSTAVVFLLETIGKDIRLNFEGLEFKFFSFDNLPKKIGFDHREIIRDFMKKKNLYDKS